MSLLVNVITADAVTQVAESARVIDHDNRDDRVWLGKHCFWAMRNGKSVTTTPAPANPDRAIAAAEASK